MAAKTIISCKNVWKLFGPQPLKTIDLVEDGETKDEILVKTGHVVAVNDVSFDVYDGEIFVVMGLSGSGKSTLIRCFNGLNKPTRGQIIVDAVDLSNISETELREIRRHKISMVFQHFALFPHFTVTENVAYGLELQGVNRAEREARAAEVLALVGLGGWEYQYPQELSGGMQQRVGLARALALDPEILLMDEAFSALDPLIRRQMHDEFINLMEKVKKTIIFITHDFNEAIRLGSRIAIMKDGKIIQIGTPEEIVCTPIDNYVAQFIKDVPREKVVKVDNIMRPPKLTISNNQPPVECLKKMKMKNVSKTFLLDKNDQVVCSVKIEDVVAIVAQNNSDWSKITNELSSVIRSGKPIKDLIPIMAACEGAVAVVDDHNRIIGEISMVALLKALSEKEKNHAF